MTLIRLKLVWPNFWTKSIAAIWGFVVGLLPLNDQVRNVWWKSGILKIGDQVSDYPIAEEIQNLDFRCCGQPSLFATVLLVIFFICESLYLWFSTCNPLYDRLFLPPFVRLIAFSSVASPVASPVASSALFTQNKIKWKASLTSCSASWVSGRQGYLQKSRSISPEYGHTNRIVIETEFAIFLIINGHARSTVHPNLAANVHLPPDRRRRLNRIQSNSQPDYTRSDSLHWSANNLELA